MVMMLPDLPAEVIATSAKLFERSGHLCARAIGLMSETHALRATAARLRRAAPACRIAGGSDTAVQPTDPCGRIRRKVADGALRRDACCAAILIWGGSGRACHACEQVLALGQRGILATFPDGGILRFHATCFSAWDSDRQIAQSV
jgi:hypothetical protein